MKAVRLFISTLVCALALTVVPPPHARVAAASLSQLRGVEELKSWFNAYKGHPRLIFLLSPT